MIIPLPFISVIVPALNAEKAIKECILSLLNQNYPKNKYEIIFVDNNSTDNTYNILKKFRKRIKILKELEEGSYRARNKGLRSARGSIIAFTDSDCIVDRSGFSMLVKHLKIKSLKLWGAILRR